MLRLTGFLLLTVPAALAGNVVPPRSCSSQSLPSNNVCVGFSGFSAVGLKKVQPSKLISYSRTLLNQAICFENEIGAATILCPGIYQISFSAYGDISGVELRKKLRTTQQQEGVVAAGSAGSKGGFNQVILRLNNGDQLGVWLLGGSLKEGDISTSFSALKISD